MQSDKNKARLHSETTSWMPPLPSSLRSGLFQVGEENRPDFLRGLVLTFLQAPLSFFLLQLL